MILKGKMVLITGSGHRLGRVMALAAARSGADLIIHYGTSHEKALETQQMIQDRGQSAHLLQADLNHPDQVRGLIRQAREIGELYALVNNASIFSPLHWDDTSLDAWNQHLNINLTAPFLLSQGFARDLADDRQGRIINILDWRALRPQADHFPYTITKAGLAALTKSLATALAPKITVNGLSFGAILPPSDGQASEDILDQVPMDRWADLGEVGESLLFLLTGPTYITGEILSLDGGRLLL